MHPSRSLLATALACVLLAGCTGNSALSTSSSTTSTVVPPTATTTTSATTTSTTTLPDGGPEALPAVLPARAPFSGFDAVPLLGDDPTAIPDHPTSLDGVYWDFKVPEDLVERLAVQGFALEGTWSSDVLHSVYSYVARYADGPVYVTTDAGYHEWHLVFSKALRDTEAQVLLPLLEELVGGLLETSRAAAATDPAGQEAQADVTAYLEAVATVLVLETGPVDDRALDEVDLVALHAGFATSPTLGVEVDYSLMTPRGHYTRSEDLTRYFRAMAMLGATPFSLNEPDALRRALIVSATLTDDPGLMDAWQRIYDTTAFLVGSADDYTPVELMAAVETVSDRQGGSALGDDAFLVAVADELRATRPVLIDAERASVRVMGARFVLDSFLLDQLVDPQVGGRLEASVLDVAAAFGSDWALALQKAAGVPAAYPEYADRLAGLRDLVARRPPADWGSTVYDAWLYAILPMWLPHGNAYPDYMRTETWTALAHQAGFGSYTELKHDTVLYTKQAFAEGDAPLPPAPPRHWVEPDPVPFERLAEAARLLRNGLADRDLLTTVTGDLLDGLVSMEERFGRIARDELAGQPISDADNDWLAAIGTDFELLWLQSGDAEAGEAETGGFASEPDAKASVVVDIFSNPTQALEIATGGFDTLYVLVPNDEGQFQVAIGATYAFYEFWVPRGERLTDEEWRAMLADGSNPDRPMWLAELHG
ncbi:MAG: DUF3160 domain-containing protein [Actinobacteria bacterium]|nr:DUF3160 domain-containing protein [Actinomycetota bacterium]